MQQRTTLVLGMSLLTALAGTTIAQPEAPDGHVGHEHAPAAPAGNDARLQKIAAESTDAVFKVNETVHDFGDVFDDEPQETVFTVRNAGTTPLVLLNVQASCGCTVPALAEEQKVIEPGASTDLIVRYKPAGRRGRQTQSIRVQTNDREQPMQHLQIEALVKPRVVVEPPIAQMGRVARGEEGVVEIRIAGWVEGFESPRASVQHSKLFSVERVGVEEKGKIDLDPYTEGEGEYELPVTIYRVKLLETAPVGRHQTTVIVRTNLEGRSLVQVPVLAEVVSPVQAVPPHVMLGRLEVGQEIDHTFRLRHESEKPFQILSYDWAEPGLGLRAEVQPVDPLSPSAYTVHVTGSAPEGRSILRTGLRFRVNTDDGEEMIEVPVNAAIRPRQS